VSHQTELCGFTSTAEHQMVAFVASRNTCLAGILSGDGVLPNQGAPLPVAMLCTHNDDGLDGLVKEEVLVTGLLRVP